MTRYDNRYCRLVANQKPAPDQLETGCWPWSGTTYRGYGLLSVRVPGHAKPRSLWAHRAMELEFLTAAAQRAADDAVADPFMLGPTVPPATLPFDDTIDHQCWIRGCICPDHWTVVTRAKNTSNMRTRK